MIFRATETGADIDVLDLPPAANRASRFLEEKQAKAGCYCDKHLLMRLTFLHLKIKTILLPNWSIDLRKKKWTGLHKKMPKAHHKRMLKAPRKKTWTYHHRMTLKDRRTTKSKRHRWTMSTCRRHLMSTARRHLRCSDCAATSACWECQVSTLCHLQSCCEATPPHPGVQSAVVAAARPCWKDGGQTKGPAKAGPIYRQSGLCQALASSL